MAGVGHSLGTGCVFLEMRMPSVSSLAMVKALSLTPLTLNRYCCLKAPDLQI